ncbi:MAG TPA: type II secretion system protein GspD [Desulfonatronum sp.]|nr:type II secretion system protein GspD [Desulfonatronum sp.]
MRPISCLFVFIWLAAAMAAFPLRTLAQPPSEEDAKMTANLEGLTLRDFILFVSRFTNRNMVFQEGQIPPVKISLHSQAPMTEPELMAVLERVLASNNLDLVAQGDLYYILQAPQVSQILDPVRHPLDPGEDEELLTAVLQLDQRALGKQVGELLQPFASRFGTILEIPQAKAVLLRDTRARVRKMQEVLQAVLALGPGWDVALLPLHQAQASPTANKVSQLYAQLFDSGRLAELPVILPVEWSNALLAAGSPEQLDTVRSLLKSLDQVADVTAGMSMYSLKNAKASSASDVLRSLFQSGPNTAEDATRPASGTVVAADTETNSVMVLADPQVQKQVESVIAHLDRPLDQVFVEALIVETSLEKSRDFGVEWLVGGGGADGLISGGFLGADSRLGPLMGDPGAPIVPGGFTLGALGNAITYAGKQFSTLGALINFMKTATDFNILSTPQIMTLDNAEAEIFVGRNLPYMISEKEDANNNPIQTFEYRDVGIRLKVTPSINAETGMIRLQVEQEVKNLLEVDEKRTRPTTMSRQTRTSVQVPDGFTMVISGLMEDSLTQSRRAVPGVSRVPLFGWLFRRETVSAPKTTLMVFLTARIINTMEQAEHLTRQRMDGLREAKQLSREYLQREFWSGGMDDALDFPEDFNSTPGPAPGH